VTYIYCIYSFALSIGDSIVLELSVLGKNVKEEKMTFTQELFRRVTYRRNMQNRIHFLYVLRLLKDLAVGPYKGLNFI